MENDNDIWIFDVDGVITDPITKKIIHPQIIQKIEDNLIHNIPVCLNTGRSAEWIQKVLVAKFKESTPLKLFFASCEMGEVTLQYNELNESYISTPSQNIIPAELQATIKEIVLNSFSKTMFVDETKKSILTIEMRDGLSQNEYEEQQSKLSGEIRIILKNYHPGIHIRPSSSSIAIDVKSISSNKASGASKIITWLQSMKINFSEHSITCFGDSISDLEMADYFYNQEVKTKFIYVGTDNLNHTSKYSIISTKAKNTEGTLEYLLS